METWLSAVLLTVYIVLLYSNSKKFINDEFDTIIDGLLLVVFILMTVFYIVVGILTTFKIYLF
jgi:hypothetical protein